MISLSKKKDSFSDRLNSETFFLLIKPTQSIYTNSFERDLLFQFTTQGPHKDDLEFLLNGFQIKKFGSQGQQKSLLISLKLAQYEFLKKYLDVKPLVLLDDIFDKLDQKRVELIMQLIEDKYLANTNSARENKIFGSPSFVVKNEIFWGDDRMEDAIKFFKK